MSKISSLMKTFTFQGGKTNSGMACLISISNYYRDKSCINALTKFRATEKKCDTFAQIYDCAKKIGFEVTGSSVNQDVLKTFKEPCILEVRVNNSEHYILYYSTLSSEQKYLIGDPAKGIVYMTESELDLIWRSKRLIQVKKTSGLLSKSQDHKGGYFEWLKREMKISISHVSLNLSISILTIAAAVFSQNLVDMIIPVIHLNDLIKGFTIVCFILIVCAYVGYLRLNLLNQESQKSSDEMMSNFLKKFIHLPITYFDQSKDKIYHNRLNDIVDIQKHLAYLKNKVTLDLFMVFSSIAFFAWYSVPVALLTCIFISLYLGVTTYINQASMTKQRQVALNETKQQSRFQYLNILNGADVLKSINHEDYFISKIKETQEMPYYQSIQMKKLKQQISIVTDLLSVAFILSLLTTGCFLVLNKELKISEMLIILILILPLLPAVSRLSQLYSRVQKISVSIEHVNNFMVTHEEYPSEEKKELQYIDFQQLNLENVSFSDLNHDQILDDISFQISKGEIIAILGKSNSGKSKLLSILQKHFTVDSGLITVNGQSLKHISIPSWRNIISLVNQDVKLFHGNILENISIGQSQNDSLSVISFCKRTGFDQFFSSLPNGYFTMIEENDSYLSKGYKQLIAVTRALYRKPQILLMDEATSSMDDYMEKFVLEVLCKLKRTMAIIMITQEMRTTIITDNVFILRDGKLERPYQLKTFYS